jgi:hypothetical protein
VSVAAVLLLGLVPGAAVSAVFVLSDFETAPDLAQWEPTGAIVYCPDGWCDPTPATLSRVTANATSGSYSCLLGMPPPPTSWPGMNLTSFPITDWSGYDVFLMDFYNPNAFALLLHVEISDSVAGSSWAKRYYTERTLIPGANTIEIDLHNLPRNDDTGDVDAANIGRFLFYGSGFSSATDMYCDYVRLETVVDDPWADASREIYKFDFGTDTSPRWPDFFRVTAADTYPVGGGWWGWSGGDPRYDADLGGPDDLCRDCTRNDVWGGAGQQMDFRLDVPNDTYGIYVIARSGEWHGMPVRGWQVWAEGVLQAETTVDSTSFYSDSYYYRGIGDGYPLTTSYWERYVDPHFPAYGFSVAVSDGHLDLSFVDCWAYMLIVYPTSLSGEMSGRIADWEADRAAEFAATYYVNEPYDLTFTPTSAETVRGYAAWPVPTLDPCHADTLPPDPRPSIALQVKAARGETRAANLAIRALTDLTNVWVEVTDLSDGDGHTIPAAATNCRHVRYMAGPNSEFFVPVLNWRPHILQDDFPIGIPEQITKQFWLDVHVPNDAEGGTYTGTVTIHTSGTDLVVPLTVTVWPFELDPADHMSYGWYYVGPDDRYCFKDFPGLAGAGDDMLRLDFADMLAHGFNAVQFPTPECWPVNPSTGWVDGLNMTELDRYVSAMADTGFGGLGHDQAGTLSIANQILRHSSVSEFDSNFNASYKDVLGRIVDWGSTSGLPLVMYLVDEPREAGIQSWNRNLADTLAYCDLANQVPGVVSTVTVMSDSNGGLDYTVIVDETDVAQTHPWSASSGLITKALAQEKPIWFYNTWDHDMWSQHRWADLRFIYGYYQYEVGDGCWEWHFDWLDGGGWDPFPYSPFNNQWHFTYPSPNGPIATLKYEWASQGISDYRYAATLARLADEAKTTGIPEFIAWANQAEALLQSLLDDIPDYPVDSGEYFAGLSPGPSYCADLEAALDSYRQQIADRIAERADLGPGAKVVLEVHPNERAPGQTPKQFLGLAPWTQPTTSAHPSYVWQKYVFAAGDNLWIQICAQNWDRWQKGYASDDNTWLDLNGVKLADWDGIQNGPPGGWQWVGSKEKGQRWTLRFLWVGGMQGIQTHNLWIGADESPLLWWIKVTDLEEASIYPPA